MSARLYGVLDPLLRESISRNDQSDGADCGCYWNPSKPHLIHLCDYHEGFEDGLDAAARAAQ